MTPQSVNVLCRNPFDDRVISRFSRYLRDNLGWSLTARPDPSADVYYLSGYFEETLLRPWPKKPVAAYFTHREMSPPGNSKSALFDKVASRVDLRIVTARMYLDQLSKYGPTVQVPPPVERDRFTILRGYGPRMTAGFSGFTYLNKRKGEDFARSIVNSKIGRLCEWRASGRGWPVPTKLYSWSEMPGFYKTLDVLVITSRVEGVPMPALEALSCGTSIVAPRGVGLLDELPDAVGIHRYDVDDVEGCLKALHESLAQRVNVNRDLLRLITTPYTVSAWCDRHSWAISRLFAGEEEKLKRVLDEDDDYILNMIRHEYPGVSAVLSWTGRHIPYIKRQIAPYQGAFLALAANNHNRPGARFLEIGTALGYSACLMSTAAPSATVTTLNPKDGEFERAERNLRIRSTVRVVKSTSQDFFKSDSDMYDLIFVDGDHSYEVVLHDSQFFNRLYPGGMILFHDYSPVDSVRPSAGSHKALNYIQEKRRTADVVIIGSGRVGMIGWIRQDGEVWD